MIRSTKYFKVMGHYTVGYQLVKLKLARQQHDEVLSLFLQKCMVLTITGFLFLATFC